MGHEILSSLEIRRRSYIMGNKVFIVTTRLRGQGGVTLAFY